MRFSLSALHVLRGTLFVVASLAMAELAACGSNGASRSSESAVGDDGASSTPSGGPSGPGGSSASDGGSPVTKEGEPYVLLFGGSPKYFTSTADYLGDTWVWNGKEWRVASVAGPPARVNATAAALDDKVVLFGGFDGELRSDTWIWDGKGWKEHTGNGPPKYEAAIARLGNKLVLYAGMVENTYGSETWTWDGAAWTKLSITSPPTRGRAAMATFGNEVVLYGGNTHDQPALGSRCLTDTWIFDGASWTLAKDASPIGAPCQEPRAAMAELGGKLHRYDGNLLYTWDGASWTSTSRPKGAAWPLASAPLTPFGGELFLFGGADAASIAVADTWSFDGSAWEKLSAAGPTQRADTVLVSVSP